MWNEMSAVQIVQCTHCQSVVGYWKSTSQRKQWSILVVEFHILLRNWQINLMNHNRMYIMPLFHLISINVDIILFLLCLSECCCCNFPLTLFAEMENKGNAGKEA